MLYGAAENDIIIVNWFYKIILENFKTHNNRQVSSLDVDGETDTAANEREEEFRTLAVP